MCYIDSCGKANELGGRFQAGACKQHFEDLKKKFATDYSGLNANTDLCHDIALAYVFMSDEAAVLDRLDGLNDFLSQVDPIGHGISAALEYFEVVCWFPQVRVIPTGVLSDAKFLDLIAHGCVLKDVGAGAPHGRLTHRLQWHALMSFMTDEFNKPVDQSMWHGTPLQLYCALGNKGLTNSNGSVWGDVFDLAGAKPEYKFRAPDRLNAALTKSSKHAIQMNLSRKLEADTANLVKVVRKDLFEAAGGLGDLAHEVSVSDAYSLLFEFDSLFGLGRVYTFDDLYQFIDQKVYKGSQHQGYANAYLYVVKTATPQAVKHYLTNKSRPTNLDILYKKNFYPPDDKTIKDRISKSKTGLNWTEGQQIKQKKGWM